MIVVLHSILLAFIFLSSCNVDSVNRDSEHNSPPNDNDDLETFLNAEYSPESLLDDSLNQGISVEVVDAKSAISVADNQNNSPSKLKTPPSTQTRTLPLSNFTVEEEVHHKFVDQELSKSHSQDEVKDLLSEISILRKNLAEKVRLISGLKKENQSLEKRLLNLSVPFVDPSHSNVTTNNPIEIKSKSINSGSDKLNLPQNLGNSDACELSFDAGLSLQNGKFEEAFYCEFFLLPESLEIIARKIGLSLNDFSDVSSFTELWVKSFKYPYQFPNISKRIRNYLLDEVAKGKGFRVRTDVSGNGIISKVPTGIYFLIGHSSLGITGVAWNVPVNLKNGTNRISLTSQNATWFQ